VSSSPPTTSPTATPQASDKPSQHVSAIILAGGEGSRVGYRDKGLLVWRGRQLIDHVIENLRTQVDAIVISANRHIEQYQQRGFAVVADVMPDFSGPLAGIAAAYAQINADYVLTVPCDMPQLPRDLAARLLSAITHDGIDCAVAQDGTYSQYLVALYRSSALLQLPDALDEGVRAARQWQQRIRSVTVDFSDQAACFGNFNTLGQFDN
jgi:molybdopterin-guanine dinucleotide biosynthesis protein A